MLTEFDFHVTRASTDPIPTVPAAGALLQAYITRVAIR
jgi:hypothetical protein